MTRNHAIAAAALLLAACQPEEESPDNEIAPAAQEEIVQNLPAPVVRGDDSAQPAVEADESSSAAKSPQPGGSLPPAGDGLRFVGLWASDAASCESRAWRFTADSLRTPAGSVCNFSSVTPVPGGYDIAARCTAEGPETDDEIEIRFAESAKAMLFESDAIADSGLVYCGRSG